jgi:hypothetical protein
MTALDRTPPHDAEAERAAISLCLSRGKIPEPLNDLVPADFYLPVHETVWATLRHLLGKGGACDATAVYARLTELHKDNQARNALELLPSLVSVRWVSDAATLTGIILDRSGRRHVIEATSRTLQAAYDDEADYETILQRAEHELAKVPARDSGNVDSLVTLDEFLGESVPEPEWVVDGLLAKGERLILTGLEGWGKSTLCRQIALCAAAGIEPFTGRRIEPKTVLMVDAENPQFIMQKRLSELRQAINAHGGQIPQGRLWMDRRPDGMNLGEAADRRWLQRRVNVVNPDLLVIGPAYKLHDASNDDKDETIARTVTSVLDDIRGQAALVLEHHAGNEQAGNQRPVRPFGSSLWRRWPEFGYGIRPIRPPKGMTEADVIKFRFVDLVSWRGARDVRNWPKQMQSGGDGLPWVEWTEEAA